MSVHFFSENFKEPAGLKEPASLKGPDKSLKEPEPKPKPKHFLQDSLGGGVYISTYGCQMNVQ